MPTSGVLAAFDAGDDCRPDAEVVGDGSGQVAECFSRDGAFG